MSQPKLSFIASLPYVIVGALTTAMLLLVGHGEGLLLARDFQFSKLNTVGNFTGEWVQELASNGYTIEHIQRFSVAGDTAQFGGISGLQALDGIDLYLVDSAGSVIHPPGASLDATPTHVDIAGYDADTILSANANHHRWLRHVRDRQGNNAGSIVVQESRLVVQDVVKSHFFWPVIIASILFLIYCGVIYYLRSCEPRSLQRGARFAYIILFIGVAGLLLQALTTLAHHDLEKRADTISQQLNDRFAAIDNAEHVAGLHNVLAEELHEASDIAGIALLHDGHIIAAAGDALNTGSNWEDSYPGFVSFVQSGSGESAFALGTLVPNGVIRDRIFSVAKNVIILLIACWFLADIALQLSKSLQAKHQPKLIAATTDSVIDDGEARARLALTIIQVIWFAIVFIEGLNASFLPSYLSEQTGAQYASLPFAAFLPALCWHLFPLAG